MKNRFDSFIENGLSEASKVQNNLSEIYGVFNELNSSIKKKMGSGFSLSLETTSGGEILFDMFTRRMEKIEDYELRGSLTLKADGKELKVCRWRRSPDGYPFTLINDMTQYECDDKDVLIESLGFIFSSGSLWLKIQKSLSPSDLGANTTNSNNHNIELKTDKKNHSDPV